jgi:hypothetical protein
MSSTIVVAAQLDWRARELSHIYRHSVVMVVRNNVTDLCYLFSIPMHSMRSMHPDSVISESRVWVDEQKAPATTRLGLSID